MQASTSYGQQINQLPLSGDKIDMFALAIASCVGGGWGESVVANRPIIASIPFFPDASPSLGTQRQARSGLLQTGIRECRVQTARRETNRLGRFLRMLGTLENRYPESESLAVCAALPRTG